MRLFRKAPFIIAEITAFCWFMLCRIPFLYLLPLIPIGVFWRRVPPFPMRIRPWLNGLFLISALFICCRLLSVSLYNGSGFASLVLLLILTGCLISRAAKPELNKISVLWAVAFWCAVFALTVGALRGIGTFGGFSVSVSLSQVLIFYFFALAEPLCFDSFSAAPLLLGSALLPFAAVSYFALGAGAFALAEFPYLSVWSGVSVAAFHHLEGPALGLLCGLGALRAEAFFRLLKKDP